MDSPIDSAMEDRGDGGEESLRVSRIFESSAIVSADLFKRVSDTRSTCEGQEPSKHLNNSNRGTHVYNNKMEAWS